MANPNYLQPHPDIARRKEPKSKLSEMVYIPVSHDVPKTYYSDPKNQVNPYTVTLESRDETSATKISSISGTPGIHLGHKLRGEKPKEIITHGVHSVQSDLSVTPDALNVFFPDNFLAFTSNPLFPIGIDLFTSSDDQFTRVTFLPPFVSLRKIQDRIRDLPNGQIKHVFRHYDPSSYLSLGDPNYGYAYNLQASQDQIAVIHFSDNGTLFPKQPSTLTFKPDEVNTQTQYFYKLLAADPLVNLSNDN